jgi:hypothetical protein
LRLRKTNSNLIYLNRPGTTIPGAYERGVMLTGYPTPERPCNYWSMSCMSVSIMFAASSRYIFASAAQHFLLLSCNILTRSTLCMCASWKVRSLCLRSSTRTYRHSMSLSMDSTLNCATFFVSFSCSASF